MSLQLQGIISPITTPFENGHFAPRRLIENLAKWNEAGLAGYLVLGSTGEAPLLSEAEKLEIVRVARREIPADKVMIVGASAESTEATKVFTLRVADLGAEAVLVLNPFYFRDQISTDALRRHFEAVAEASPIPILLYNVPKFTGVNLPPALVMNLAQHPNVIGMKDSSGHLVQMLDLREKLSPHFQILVGADAIIFAALASGFRSAILAIANLTVRECVQLARAVEANKFEEARLLARKLATIGSAVFRRHGIAGLKAALDEMGYFGGDPRPPLLPVSASARKEIRAVLEQVGIL